MDKIKTLLRVSPLFSGLPEDDLGQVASQVRKQTSEKGTIIFQEDDQGSGLYLIASGKIKIFKSSFEGKEQILHIYGSGQTFGEVSVFSGKNFPASALVLEDAVLFFCPESLWWSLSDLLLFWL